MSDFYKDLIYVYKDLIYGAPFGYAYHEVIVDESGIPIDYKFLEINAKFKEITGLDDSIISRNITEILPDIRKGEFDWIKEYGQVALTGETKEFKQYSKPLDSWFYIQSSSNKKFFFTTLFVDITESKQAEEKIKSQNELLLTINETTPVGIVTVDKSGNITYANKRAEEILGLVKDEITSLTYDAPLWNHINIDGSPFPDEKQPFNIVKTTMSSTYDIQHGIIWPDGTVVFLSINASPMKDIHGNFDGMLATIENITESKKAEALLRESEYKYRMLFENMNVSFALHEIICDNNGEPVDYRFLEMNPLFLKNIGKTVSEVQGHTAKELFPNTEQYWIDTFGKVAKTGESISYQNYTRELDQWYDIFVFSPENNQFAAFFLDITSEKLALQNNIAHIDKLSKNDIFNQLILKTSLDGYIKIGTDGLFLDASDKYCEMIGYTKSQLLKIHINKIDAIESEEETKIHFDKIFKLGHDRFETKHLKKDGTVLDVEASVHAIPDEDYFIAFIRDITERKQAEKEKNVLKEQLAQIQKMESIGRLAGGVAHDFNNILSVILGHTELAMDMITENDDLYSNLKEIHSAALRSANLTKQLLAFARRQPVSPKILNVGDSISERLDMLKRLIGENIELIWEEPSEEIKIKMDPSQFDQILINLFVNAKDAIDGHGEIIVKVERNIISNIPYVLISIKDSGRGMTKDILDKIFEPFYTTKEVGKGTGLGLPTVYGIVNQNEGEIKVESSVNKGTTFNILFPEEKNSTNEVSIQHENNLSKGSETILLIEDESSILLLMTNVLRKSGYTVIPCISPELGLQKASENKIDLLLTDVIMPGMNGRQVCELLRNSMPNLKCLYMSGYTYDVIHKNGVIDSKNFIQKPFALPIFLRKIRQVLEEEEGGV